MKWKNLKINKSIANENYRNYMQKLLLEASEARLNALANNYAKNILGGKRFKQGEEAIRGSTYHRAYQNMIRVYDDPKFKL